MRGMERIDQILADMQYGDAVSDNALAIRTKLRAMGKKSEIYAENIHPLLYHEVKPLSSYQPGGTVLHHFAIGSDSNHFVLTLSGVRKILIYHNITPAHFFEGYNLKSELSCEKARIELQQCAGRYDMALAVSEYNKRELEDYGFTNVRVLPIIYSFNRLNVTPDSAVLKQFGQGNKKNILFLGRIAPNKKQQDVVKAFYYYKTLINPDSRLLLVGSYHGMEKYANEISHLIAMLKLEDVYLTGQVTANQMTAYYQVSDLFLSMSEHEGFCVPLLESMFFDLPILAYDSSAVGETLGKAGILFTKKDFKLVAEMMHLMLSDDHLRKKIISGQRKRLSDFSEDMIAKRLETYLTE